MALCSTGTGVVNVPDVGGKNKPGGELNGVIKFVDIFAARIAIHSFAEAVSTSILCNEGGLNPGCASSELSSNHKFTNYGSNGQRGQPKSCPGTAINR